MLNTGHSRRKGGRPNGSSKEICSGKSTSKDPSLALSQLLTEDLKPLVQNILKLRLRLSHSVANVFKILSPIA